MEQLNGGTYLSLPANLAELGYAEGDVLTELQGKIVMKLACR